MKDNNYCFILINETSADLLQNWIQVERTKKDKFLCGFI